MSDLHLPFFVYGTLRTGYGNHRTFGQSVRKVQPGHLHGASMSASGVPFVYRTAEGRVFGEVITVDPAMYVTAMRSLDALEGYRGPGANNLYDREIVEIVLATGETVQAYAYLVSAEWASGYLPVPSGDYADHRPAHSYH